MPSQLSKGTTYVNGDTVTYNNLNNLVDNGTILKGAITEQTEKSVPVGADQILIADSASTGSLKKATITSVFASAPNIGSTTAGTGAFTTLSSTGSSSFANTSGNVSVGFDKNAAQSKLHIAHDSSSDNGFTITDTNALGADVKSVSFLQSSSTTASVITSTNHGYSAGDSVVISGAVQTEYNGLYKVLSPSSTTFTYTFAGSSTANATGTISCRKTKGANYQIGGNSSSVGKLFFKDLNTATTTLAIDASGNVGIGNTAPSTKLEVTGDIKASTNSTVGTAASSVSISTITYSTTTATVTTSSAHGFTTGDFIRIAGASESVYNGSFAITVTGTPSTSTTFTYTLPSTPTANASGASLLCYKDNFAKVTGHSFISNRLGVGTTVPSTELHVVGNALITGTATVSGQLTSSGIIAQRTSAESATAVTVAGTVLASGAVTSAYGTSISGLKITNFVPKSATSKIKVVVKGRVFINGGATKVGLALYKVATGSTFPPATAVNATAVYASKKADDNDEIPYILEYEVTSGATTGVDFNVMAFKDGNTVTFNPDLSYSPATKAIIEVTEYF